MSIPEVRLESWASLGSVPKSAETYNSIETALNRHRWPEGMNCKIYLQGSYANSTHIRSNSDVDVVAETENVFWSNLTEAEKQALSLTPGRYSFDDFRRQVILALESHYERDLVDSSGAKSIKVRGTSGRLNADVVPCGKYKKYVGMREIAEGITFWNQHNGEQVINYPKLHKSNGESKNSFLRTRERYKSSVRMFKNARENIVGDSRDLAKKFPSYFIECLVFNAPDELFSQLRQKTYLEVHDYFLDAFAHNRTNLFLTQSQQDVLLGSSSVQWNPDNAREFVVRLGTLWSNWSRSI